MTTAERATTPVMLETPPPAHPLGPQGTGNGPCATVLTVFNHKGGVGKTTATVGLAWKLAQDLEGKKVCVVDLDAQCNATGNLIDPAVEAVSESIFRNTKENVVLDDPLSQFYEKYPRANMAATLAPMLGDEPLRTAFGIQGRGCDAVIPHTYQVCKRREFLPEKYHHYLKDVPEPPANLYLLANHIDFTECEAALPTRQQRRAEDYVNIPGCLAAVFRRLRTPAGEPFDYILCDLSPSASALNQLAIMSSTFFMVPCSPDYYSHMAIKGLAKHLPKWSKNFLSYRQYGGTNDPKPNPDFAISEHLPIFLGHTIQVYTKTSSAGTKGAATPANAHAVWCSAIDQAVADVLLPRLQHIGMAFSKDRYTPPPMIETESNLCRGYFINRQSLGAVACGAHVPSFALTNKCSDLVRGKKSTISGNESTNRSLINQFFNGLRDLLESPASAAEISELLSLQIDRAYLIKHNAPLPTNPADVRRKAKDIRDVMGKGTTGDDPSED